MSKAKVTSKNHKELRLLRGGGSTFRAVCRESTQKAAMLTVFALGQTVNLWVPVKSFVYFRDGEGGRATVTLDAKHSAKVMESARSEPSVS